MPRCRDAPRFIKTAAFILCLIVGVEAVRVHDAVHKPGYKTRGPGKKQDPKSLEMHRPFSFSEIDSLAEFHAVARIQSLRENLAAAESKLATSAESPAMAFVKNLLFKHPSTAALRSEVEGLRERLAKAEAAELRASSSLFMSIAKGLVTVPHRGHRLEIENPYLAAEAGLAESTTEVNPLVVRRLTTAAERAECLAGSEGSCDNCCEGITGKCQELTVSGPDRFKLDKIPGLTEQDDCLLLKGNYNKVDATSPRLKRPWLFLASARRVGLRRRRRDRRRGQVQPPLRQRLPRPSGILMRRRLVRARAARRPRRRFAHA